MLVLLVLCFEIAFCAGSVPVGVIRWDAWNQITTTNQTWNDNVAWYTRQTLTPPRFQYRLPFFAKIEGDKVLYNADNQQIMDQEIQYAHKAGLSFWAFDTYCTFQRDCITTETLCVNYISTTSAAYCPQKPAYGLSLYLASSLRHLINFTLIILGSPVCRPGAIQSYVDLMSEPGFQKTPEGRPILFMFQFSDGEANACGGWNAAKQNFDSLRSYAKSKGIMNPYLVLMDFNPSTALSHARALGFDAISTYALPGGDNSALGVPFMELSKNSQNWWSEAEKIGAEQVPIIATGWDPRPRAAFPNPFVNEGPEHYAMPTGMELQDLVKKAVDFTCKSPSTPSKAIIVYAWNESNENGAALIPSLGNGTLYVDALQKVLPASCPSTLQTE